MEQISVYFLEHLPAIISGLASLALSVISLLITLVKTRQRAIQAKVDKSEKSALPETLDGYAVIAPDGTKVPLTMLNVKRIDKGDNKSAH